MKRENFNHGFSDDVWEAAKEEAREAMRGVALSRSLISYSDLVAKIHSIPLEPNSDHLSHMLGEISTEEHDQGRGLLSVVVVHKQGSQMPGKGFFKLAQSLGHDTTDNLTFWIEELERVHDRYSAQGVKTAEKMRGQYGVLRWDSKYPVTVMADEINVNTQPGTLTLKLDGKVVAEFKSFDAWWFKELAELPKA